jgi:hypothetical protein
VTKKNMRHEFSVTYMDGRYRLLRNGIPYVVELLEQKRPAVFRNQRMARASARLYDFLAKYSK